MTCQEHGVLAGSIWHLVHYVAPKHVRAAGGSTRTKKGTWAIGLMRGVASGILQQILDDNTVTLTAATNNIDLNMDTDSHKRITSFSRGDRTITVQYSGKYNKLGPCPFTLAFCGDTINSLNDFFHNDTQVVEALDRAGYHQIPASTPNDDEFQAAIAAAQVFVRTLLLDDGAVAEALAELTLRAWRSRGEVLELIFGEPPQRSKKKRTDNAILDRDETVLDRGMAAHGHASELLQQAVHTHHIYFILSYPKHVGFISNGLWPTVFHHNEDPWPLKLPSLAGFVLADYLGTFADTADSKETDDVPATGYAKHPSAPSDYDRKSRYIMVMVDDFRSGRDANYIFGSRTVMEHEVLEAGLRKELLGESEPWSSMISQYMNEAVCSEQEAIAFLEEQYRRTIAVLEQMLLPIRAISIFGRPKA